MFVVNEDLSIYATRGDIVCLNVSATDDKTGAPYEFQPGDIVRMKIYGKKNAENVVMQKDFPVVAKTDTVGVFLTEEDTKIGDVISKPTDYWYEIELNPYTNPQTIVGYDEDGAKVFKLFPEGKDIQTDEPTKPEDIPVVDKDLDLTSSRPVENRAIARAVTLLKNDLEAEENRLTAKISEVKSANRGLAVKVEENNVSTKQEIAVERARIDQMIAAPAAEDAELTDIRVGADGVTYSTAGESVRKQFNTIAGDLLVRAPMFDPNRVLNQSGGTDISASWATSDYIPVFANVSFTIQAYAGTVCFYNSDKTVRTGDGSYNPVSASPYVENGRKFCVDFDGYMRFVILQSGSFAANPDEVFVCYHMSNLKQNVAIHGKMDGRNFGKRILCRFSEISSESGVYGDSGSISGSENYLRNTEYIPVRELSTYWIRKMYQVTGHFYDADKNYICDLKRVANSDDGVLVTDNAVFITPKNAHYIRINSSNADKDIQCIGYGDTSLTDEQIAIESVSKIEMPWIKADIMDALKARLVYGEWYGKRFATFGDSITWQDGKEYNQGSNVGETARGYQTIIKEKCGFASYDNYGVSGAPMASGSANGDGTVDTIRKTDFTGKNYDLVIVAVGTNDFKLGIPIGEIGSEDTKTFHGAYLASIKTVLNANAKARIVLFTPLHRDNDGYDDDFVNKAGHKLIDYVNAVREIGERNSIPVCDMYANSGINALNLYTYTMDGLHPNNVGYERMGAYCSAYLKNI